MGFYFQFIENNEFLRDHFQFYGQIWNQILQAIETEDYELIDDAFFMVRQTDLIERNFVNLKVSMA